MLQGSGGQRLVAQAQVIFGAGQVLGRVEDLALLARSGGGLARGLPVATPGPGRAERGPVRGHQRKDYEGPDPGAEAIQDGTDHAVDIPAALSAASKSAA